MAKANAKDTAAAVEPEHDYSEWFFDNFEPDGGGGGGGAPYSGMTLEEKAECRKWIESGGKQ